MIWAYKAILFPTSIRKKRGMMSTHIVKRMKLAVIVSTYQKFNIPQPTQLTS